MRACALASYTQFRAVHVVPVEFDVVGLRRLAWSTCSCSGAENCCKWAGFPRIECTSCSGN